MRANGDSGLTEIQPHLVVCETELGAEKSTRGAQLPLTQHLTRDSRSLEKTGPASFFISGIFLMLASCSWRGSIGCARAWANRDGCSAAKWGPVGAAITYTPAGGWSLIASHIRAI